MRRIPSTGECSVGAGVMIAALGGFVLFVVLGGCGRPAGPLLARVEPAIVWPAPPDPPRIRLLGTLSGSEDLRAAQSGLEVLGAALSGPRPPIKFSGPHMAALGPGNWLAVADGAGGAVHVLDLDRRTHTVISGWDRERLLVPLGVTWAGPRLFVTDAQRHEVIELDVQGGQQEDSIALRRNGPSRALRVLKRFAGDSLTRPVGIAHVAARNQLYVVDGGAHRLAVFDVDGTFVRNVGQRGTEPGAFNFPSHIANRGDRLLVADSGNFRVQLLDLDGACLRIIGQKGDAAGDLSLPKGVAFDSEGHIYVVDSQFENIQVYDDAGRLLLAFGQEGTRPGEFSLPAGLTIDPQDRIWAADSGNRRLQVFEYLRAAP